MILNGESRFGVVLLCMYLFAVLQIVLPKAEYYLQALSDAEAQEWLQALEVSACLHVHVPSMLEVQLALTCSVCACVRACCCVLNVCL